MELLVLVALGAYWLAPSTAESDGPVTAAEWDAFVALHTAWCGTDDAPAPSEFTLAER